LTAFLRRWEDFRNIAKALVDGHYRIWRRYLTE
jgi:hypothetical protein